ncbi:MAG TPA: RNA methyltransferase [Chromobacteriaceae bacterium]|nr:RNA methyltransferase [Chromobacteriaceae bacterium]
MAYQSKIITSPQNEEIKHLNRLVQNGRERRKEGVMVLEGLHLTQSCLEAGGQLRRLYLNERALDHPELKALLTRLPDAAVVVTVPDSILARVTALNTAAEVLAVCARPQPAMAAADASRVLLEDIQDPGNLGTILRCAAASGVREVFLSKGCVDIFSPKVLRAGMGAHFALNLHEQAELADEMCAFGGRKLVTHLDGSVSLYHEDLTGPVALVFGNEGAGVSASLVAQADARVRIPMPGHAESLNVAMAATVCLFERVRQCEAKAGR